MIPRSRQRVMRLCGSEPTSILGNQSLYFGPGGIQFVASVLEPRVYWEPLYSLFAATSVQEMSSIKSP